MNPVVSQPISNVGSLQTYSREELEQRVQELTDFVENASLPLHWVDSEGIIVWANQAELDLLGYHAEEYIGHPIINFHADRSVIHDILIRLSNNETLRNYPARIKCKDGSIKHVLINSNVFRQGGEFIHTRCFTRDITLIKQAEEKSARLAAIVESSDDAIVSKTLNGIITSWNKSAERMFGYVENEVLGQSITILIPDDRLQEEQLIIERIRNGEKVEHFEAYRLTKDKTKIPVSLTISPIKDANGLIIGASKIVRDISKQKAFEDKLQRYADNVELLNTIGKQIAELIEIDEILQKVIDITVLVTRAAFGAFFYYRNEQKMELVKRLKLSGTDKKIFEDFYANYEPLFKSFVTDDEPRGIFGIYEGAEPEKEHELYSLMKKELPFSRYLIVPLISKTGLAMGGCYMAIRNLMNLWQNMKAY